MRVHYKTFGCKANQYDTERMRQALEAAGAQPGQAALEGADLCVVNTCTVTNRADAEARRFARRTARRNPRAVVIVAGCSAALQADDYAKMDEVAGVVGGHDPGEVVAAARSALAPEDAACASAAAAPPRLPSSRLGDAASASAKRHGGRAAAPAPRLRLVQLGTRRPLEREHVEPVAATALRRRAGATRGWLKVQDGCDRKCAFCATRLARGRSRSRPPDEVVAEARVLARTHPELVVTGVHIGHYGRDLSPRQSLAGLVRRLLDAVPAARFRLGSIEATEVDERMIALLADSDGRLAPHLHMPLQSGADPVLRRMRRWHTREQYRRRVLRIASAAGPVGMGADVITGFPGESAADHEQTRALVEELPFTYLHVFPYSVRDGTRAAGLSGRVPERLARERGAELRQIAAEKGRRYARSRGGGAAEVVMEGSRGTALTGDYLRVAVESPEPPDPSVLHRGRLTPGGSRVVVAAGEGLPA